MRSSLKKNVRFHQGIHQPLQPNILPLINFSGYRQSSAEYRRESITPCVPLAEESSSTAEIDAMKLVRLLTKKLKVKENVVPKDLAISVNQE
jgi:hypothetical protein